MNARGSSSRSSAARQKHGLRRRVAPRSPIRPRKRGAVRHRGGSSEIVWLAAGPGAPGAERVRHWTSLQLGVVTLAEKFGGAEVSFAEFSAMTDLVEAELQQFLARASREERCQRFHLLGTSGTVTTLAGVHLNLPRYDRRRVDGLWMSRAEIDAVMNRLRGMSYAERVQNSCIGPEHADLVLAGCAILEGFGLLPVGADPHRRPRSARGHAARTDARRPLRRIDGAVHSELLRLRDGAVGEGAANGEDDEGTGRRGRPGIEDAGENRAETNAFLDPVAPAAAERPLCRAGQARGLALARRFQAAGDR